MAKITTADCVKAIKASPAYRNHTVKRRSKNTIDGKIVRIFEVENRNPLSWTQYPYVRVVEESNQIVQILPLRDLTVIPTREEFAAFMDLLEPPLIGTLSGVTTALVASPPETGEATDDIDVERFKRMVEKTDEPEGEIDSERFKQIERK